MSPERRVSVRTKAALILRIWYWYVRVRLRTRRGNLADVVDWLGRGDHAGGHGASPWCLGRIVGLALPFRFSRATCLAQSLVLFRLLHRNGVNVELVVGLPKEPTSHDAHAWTEVDGTDVGPPPGGAGCIALARYKAGSPPSASPGQQQDPETGSQSWGRAGWNPIKPRSAR